MSSAEGQLQVRLSLAALHLAACRRDTLAPRNALAGRIRGLNDHSPSSESIPENIAHIVPDRLAIQVVREYRLADVWLEEPVLHGGDLDGNATRLWIAMELLAVGLIKSERDLRSDLAADRPEIDGGVALVGDDGTADSLGTGDEGEKSERVEDHRDEGVLEQLYEY